MKMYSIIIVIPTNCIFHIYINHMIFYLHSLILIGIKIPTLKCKIK